MVVMAMPVPAGMLVESDDMTDRLGLVGAPFVEGFGLVASRAATASTPLKNVLNQCVRLIQYFACIDDGGCDPADRDAPFHGPAAHEVIGLVLANFS